MIKIEKRLIEARKILNYNKIDYFEENSINLLAVLLDYYNSFNKIKITFKLKELLKIDKYRPYLLNFKIAEKQSKEVELKHLLYDVKAILKKRNFIIETQ